MLLSRIFANIARKAKPNVKGTRNLSGVANPILSQFPNDSAAPLLCGVEKQENSKGLLQLTWQNGAQTSFSSVFLRDCCRCSECFDKAAKQRMLDTVEKVSLDIIPDRAEINTDDVRIVWPDGHESSYTHEFLWDRQNTSQNDDAESEEYDIRYIKATPWKASDISGKIPTFDFNSVLENDATKYNWFREFSRFGVTILNDAGREEGVLHRLKQLFGGYFKSTHYGETFKVVTKSDPSSLAYTPKAILPHVDLPHYEYMPGVQVLHCIDQFTGCGADSILIDGFNVAKQLKELDAKSYDVLTKYKITYRDLGTDFFGEFETFYERPVIEEKDGVVRRFSYSNWLRDYHLRGSGEEIHHFYESYYKLTKLMNEQVNVLTFKLEEGQVLCFDNKRLVHGRTAMVGEEATMSRYLHGCYFDWDGLYTHMRPVKRRLDTLSVK